jgi:hypothetical protein
MCDSTVVEHSCFGIEEEEGDTNVFEKSMRKF